MAIFGAIDRPAYCRKTYTSILALAVAVPALSAVAAAEEADKRIAPISVTATRSPIEAFEFPGMVTVIDRDEIERRQASTPADILGHVPGVEFTSGPRRTGMTPSVRGFSGSDVVILIDGVRQNFGSAHDGRFFLDPSVVEQAEVLRGGASSLYGSGGTGGVIEFRTLDARKHLQAGESAQLEAKTGYHTANREWHVTTNAFAKPIEGLGVVGSLTRRSSGSIRLGNGGELGASDDDLLSGLAKLNYDLGGGHELSATYLGFNNDAQEPNNGQSGTANDIVDKEIQSDTYRLGYNFKDPSNALIDLDAVVYFQEFSADELRLDNNGAGPAGELLKRDVETFGFRLDNRSRFDFGEALGLTLTYGTEGYRDEQDGASASGNRDGVPDADTEFYGIYAQAELAWNNPFGVLPGDLLVIPGVRYDDYKASSALAATDTEDDSFSPKVGVSYLPNDWLVLFANYAEAFRAPDINELYLSGVHFAIPAGSFGPGSQQATNRFIANPDLKPQTTETFEFGAGLTFDDVAMEGDRFQVKASHYRTDGENFIDLEVTQPAFFTECNPFIPGNCDGTTRNFNVADAELDGTEVEASYDNERVRFVLGYSEVDGENTQTGAKLGVLTPDQLHLDSMLKLPEFDSLAGWRIEAADEFDKVNAANERRDGYVVHDIYAAWAPTSGALQGVRLDLGIDNIFDKAYARAFTDANEPGRDYKIAVSYAFTW